MTGEMVKGWGWGHRVGGEEIINLERHLWNLFSLLGKSFLHFLGTYFPKVFSKYSAQPNMVKWKTFSRKTFHRHQTHPICSPIKIGHILITCTSARFHTSQLHIDLNKISQTQIVF